MLAHRVVQEIVIKKMLALRSLPTCLQPSYSTPVQLADLA